MVFSLYGSITGFKVAEPENGSACTVKTRLKNWANELSVVENDAYGTRKSNLFPLQAKMIGIRVDNVPYDNLLTNN